MQLLSLNIHYVNAPQVYRCEPAWSWRPIPLVDYDLWCVLHGLGNMRLAGRDIPLRPGTCFLFAPGDEPFGTHQPEHRLRVFAVHFTTANGAGEPTLIPPEERPAAGVQTSDLPLLTALVRGCVGSYRQGDALGLVRSTQFLRQIVLQLLGDSHPQAAGAADPPLDALVDAIWEDPGRPWDVAAMAAQVHLSRAQFTRRFQRATSMSPAQAVIHARVQRARQLLTESGLSVRQIADALGYRDIFYFSRQFKQVDGHPPTYYR